MPYLSFRLVNGLQHGIETDAIKGYTKGEDCTHVELANGNRLDVAEEMAALKARVELLGNPSDNSVDDDTGDTDVSQEDALDDNDVSQQAPVVSDENTPTN